MKRLEAASTIINTLEAAVAVPVKTKGSGEHESPVVLLNDFDANRTRRGNTAKAGLAYDDAGTPIGLKLYHSYEAAPTIETRSQNEVESYELAEDASDYFSVYEEFPESFHSDLNELSVGSVKRMKQVIEPPEPIHKHLLTLSLDYSDEMIVPFGDRNDLGVIEEIFTEYNRTEYPE